MSMKRITGFDAPFLSVEDRQNIQTQLEPFFAFLPMTLKKMLLNCLEVHAASTLSNNPSTHACSVVVPAAAGALSVAEPPITASATATPVATTFATAPSVIGVKEHNYSADTRQPDAPCDPLKPAVQQNWRLSITIEGARIVSMAFGVELRDAFLFCMANGVWPLRFIRNAGSLTLTEQEFLLRSRVAIIGCGALGGYVALLLARIGVGSLVLCDDDIFEETNLNRQLFCNEASLGRPKVAVAEEQLLSTASHLLLTTFNERATRKSLPYILTGAHALVDCVDSVGARIIMDEAAVNLGIPYIHGALVGVEGFAGVSFATEGLGLVRSLYGCDTTMNDDAHVIAEMGLFPSTPSCIASLQALFTVQTLLAALSGETPQNRLVHLDMGVPSLENLLF